MRTLSPRFSLVLGWGFSVVVVSEARVGRAAMRSLARMGRSLGYDCVFGEPPPPSPTFSVAPGGVAMCVRLPLTIRKLHPPELSVWESQGRVLVCEVISADWSAIVIGVYGFPLSHDAHNTNDDLISSCLAWGGCRKCRVIVMGDFNESVATCLPIAVSGEMHMSRMSPNLPSTWNRQGMRSKQAPIDHCFANNAVKAEIVKVAFRDDLVLSDHIPLVCTLDVTPSSSISWSWPSPASFPLPPRLSSPPFETGAVTFAQWSQRACRWLEQAYGIHIQDKNSVTSCSPSFPPPRLSYQYICLWKAWSATQHVEKLARPQAEQVQALKKRLLRVGLAWEGDLSALPTLKEKLHDGIDATVKHAHERLMKQWKEKVQHWRISGTAVHRYVKNDEPPKLLALLVDDQPTNHPLRMADALGSYWGGIESWPPETTEESVWDSIEDTFVPFLPHVPCGVWLTPELMKEQTKHMKRSTHGADSWAVHEIRVTAYRCMEGLPTIAQ